MKRYFGLVLLIAFAGLLFAAPLPKYEPLPSPLSNNAVASVKTRGSLLLFSLMGMGPKKNLGRDLQPGLFARHGYWEMGRGAFGSGYCGAPCGSGGGST